MWGYEPADEDYVVQGFDLSIEDIKEAHQEHAHCAFCYILNCTKVDICKIVACKYCKIKLHSCKVEDHENICIKAFSPCINSNFGCPEILRNELRGIHLSKCCASAVVCNLQWNREIIGKQAKRRMKQVARGFKKQMLDVELKENDRDELDVFAALDDQREIMESYRTFRQSRVRQRTACTPANPVLPLRFYDKMPRFPEDDSSDEEKFKELSEARMSDFHRKAFQYYWTREMHTFTCTAVMRRDEISNHWKYHTDVLQLIDGGIIKRCPSAPNGCDFYVRQLIPKNGGRIRFDEITRQFVYDPESVIPSSLHTSDATELGDFINPHILRLLLPFLDTASIRTLSSLNSRFCYLVRGLIHSRTLISIKWIRKGIKKWKFEAFERYFSNIPSVATLIPNVESNSSMATHIGICSFCERVDHSQNPESLKFMGDTFKEYLENEKKKSAEERKSEERLEF
uniref:TRAF-type domain-containing protein n=1 Tax=Panagrolaimus sp. PS1159 TaxID=55785 RepID=A0AC35G2R5_9BILA